MDRQNIQQIIRELFRDNFSIYPENYPLTEDGLMSEEGTICAQEVAKGYWAERNEVEIERDEEAGVTEIDYVEWVMAALSGLIPAAPSAPKYHDGNTILFGVSAFKQTCECGHTTHVLEIGLGFVLVQFTTGHEH